MTLIASTSRAALHSPRLLVRLAAGAVLLIAVGLKWQQLPVDLRGGDSSMLAAVWAIAVIGVEVAMGTWLFLGVWPRGVRWVPGAFFAGLAGVALYRAVGGAESCGCFGAVKVNPWVTFSADVLLAAGLWKYPPGMEPVFLWPRLTLWPRVGVVGMVVATAVGLSVWRMPKKDAAGEAAGMIQAGGLTILEPGRWIGQKLPLTSEIDIGWQLLDGRWLVVLHQAHCSTCREALPRYEALAERGAEFKVALIEMPPHESPAEGVNPPPSWGD